MSINSINTNKIILKLQVGNEIKIGEIIIDMLILNIYWVSIQEDVTEHFKINIISFCSKYN